MLEQLPGAHQVKQYSFKYNPPFDISSLEGTAEQVRLKVFLVDSESIYTKIIWIFSFSQVLKENPHGCARAEVFNRLAK